MAEQSYFSSIRKLAYDQTSGRAPGVVFLSGFNSSKEGNKALYLEAWAKQTGRAFLRFDYSGHGSSSGNFRDSTISTWVDDAEAIISSMTSGPQILVGSSMGAWIALILAQRKIVAIAGLVTIAGAPDFTEKHYWSSFDDKMRKRLETEGYVEIESPYDEEPYVITHALIEDGRNNLVFDKPLALPFPTRILHGTADTSIPVSVARELYDHAQGPDIQMMLQRGADHRFSTPECLKIITDTLDDLCNSVDQPITS